MEKELNHFARQMECETIADAIKSGETIEGCYLKTNRNLQIK